MGATTICDECQREIGPTQLLTPSEHLKLLPPEEPKPDTRPPELKEAQAVMETAEADYDRAHAAWSKTIVDQLSGSGTVFYSRLGAPVPRDTSGDREAKEKKRVAWILRERAGDRLTVARVFYYKLAKSIERKRQAEEFERSRKAEEQRQLESRQAQESWIKTATKKYFPELAGGRA